MPSCKSPSPTAGTGCKEVGGAEEEEEELEDEKEEPEAEDVGRLCEELVGVVHEVVLEDREEGATTLRASPPASVSFLLS